MTPLLDSFSSLLFPSKCLHCKEELFETKELCQQCLNQLEWLDPTLFKGHLAACFEYEGALKSLLHAFKYNDRPYLAKSLAGFMLLQYARLGWDIPDLITYIPQSFLRAATRGYNQSELLAVELGALLQIPVVGLLKRKSFTPSQTQLAKDDRKALLQESFELRSTHDTKDKHILLIDDVYTTGATIKCATKTLEQLHPRRVDAFCLMMTNPDL
ncbi:MAG: ComF family protein [Verrucomicrobia bacterium]|nr:ComF family protein [Verrucomicrobiota bacterium]MBS0636604.1 ComF family protein [Verrucomicrobiota bacterium]